MSLKVYDIYPALEKLNSASDKAKSKIECIECSDKNLFIGTNDCYVIHYLLEEVKGRNNRLSFKSERHEHKYLGLKKPIEKLNVAKALKRLLVLCDESLLMLNMLPLEPVVGMGKIKSVVSFCINPNPVRKNPFSIELCIALKKRVVQVYTLTEDRVFVTKEITTQQPSVYISMNASYICAALQDQYIMMNTETSTVQDLFPYQNERTNPLITLIKNNEYLINGPNALGVFVTTAGMSQRPPLQWSESLISVVCSYPYVLALNDEFITIHSILDQQQKQSIPFQGGQFIAEFGDKILVSTHYQIFALVPISLETQVQDLLSDRRVEEALELTSVMGKVQLPGEKYHKLMKKVLLMAGFIEFANMNFENSTKYFLKSKLDCRELIILFPNLLPSDNEFSRSIPPLHEIADILQLCKGDAEKISLYEEFLCKILTAMELNDSNKQYKMESDTALLKVYAKNNYEELIKFLDNSNRQLHDECIDWLRNRNRHYALGLLYGIKNNWTSALDIWTKIADGELEDEMFPGIEYVLDCLLKIEGDELVWSYLEWALKKDPISAVKIIIQRQEKYPQSDLFLADSIIDLLLPYNRAVTTYLEHLVFKQETKEERYHTHLAALYLERVLKIRGDSTETSTYKLSTNTELVSARKDFQRILRESSLFRVHLILGKLKNTDMYTEMAILYGKLEEHERALKLLVHKQRDFVAAEEYCEMYAKGRDIESRRYLFHSLLQVYLDAKYEKIDNLIGPTISLLNKHPAEFDPVRVLQQLPENLSIGLISSFLSSSIRRHLHGSRTSRIHRMLARRQHLQVKSRVFHEQQTSITISDNQVCDVCNRIFDEPTCVRFPNGAISHIQCSKTSLNPFL